MILKIALVPTHPYLAPWGLTPERLHPRLSLASDLPPRSQTQNNMKTRLAVAYSITMNLMPSLHTGSSAFETEHVPVVLKQRATWQRPQACFS